MAVVIDGRAMAPMQICLAESGTHALLIQFGIRGDKSPGEIQSEFAQNFCRMLVKHCGRWRVLDVSFTDMNLVSYLKDHVEQALMLETVVYNEWLSWLLDSAFFTKVPKVQNINFQFMSDPAPLETMDLSFAWEELHHLTMEYDHQDLLGRIFQG
ncbi:hypothetical protein AAF712_011732 [Marasmius tenuissimus]|uniref:Uncharacterized protein n=1 Tax=Marasmius tenuissimus TaxID=585030 RepID=A0ABR2ZJC7_9AGAR